MSKVLDWIKSNLVIVLLGAAIVAVLVLAPLLSTRLNHAVRTEAEARAAKLNQLQSLERTSMTLEVPGQAPIQETTVVNPRLLQQYETLAKALSEDARAVDELALAHNRKGRNVLIPRMFPQMPATERDTLPVEFYETLLNAYDVLLASVRAGEPPSNSEVVEALLNRESQFIMNNFRKQTRKDLDSQEIADLDQELTKARLEAYGEAAAAASFYATRANLQMPQYPPNRLPTMVEMYDWQWSYWIQEDLLHAIAAANEGSESVVTSPVKRILRVAIAPAFTASAGAGGGGAPGVGSSPIGRRGSAFGGGGDGDSGMPASEEPAAAEQQVQIDSSQKAELDYSVSFTGRKTNPLYDVRLVELDLVVAAENLPKVLNAIARRNFMTVLNAELVPADAFAAAAEGYIYGRDPVVSVRLTVETVWLRKWTVQFMPAAVRDALGLGAQAPAA